MAHLQTLTNKSGEVNFRKKLIKQHTGHLIVAPGEPNFEENVLELKGRLDRTKIVFQKFQKRGIRLSPFLEIAAGEGFRSDLLTSKFKAKGIATDISAHTLSADRIITQKLKLNKRSLKICCDANNLPFLSNSFPFVFMALSLHHFPDPAPIMKEAIRVLTPRGYFYFDDEPIKQGLNLNLWRRDYHLTGIEKVLKFFVVLIWLSRIGKSEVDHGILEETFSLEVWQKALNQFDEVEVYQSVFPFPGKTTIFKNSSSKWIYPSFYMRFGLWLFGGGIGGLCKIIKPKIKNSNSQLNNKLGCPECRRKDSLAPLNFRNNKIFCPRCKTQYRKKNGVWILLTKELMDSLYDKKN